MLVCSMLEPKLRGYYLWACVTSQVRQRVDKSITILCFKKILFSMLTLPCLQRSAPAQEILAPNAHNIPDTFSNTISLFAEWTATMYSMFPKIHPHLECSPKQCCDIKLTSWIPGSSITHHTGHVATPRTKDAVREGHTSTTFALHLAHCRYTLSVKRNLSLLQSDAH